MLNILFGTCCIYNIHYILYSTYTQLHVQCIYCCTYSSLNSRMYQLHVVCLVSVYNTVYTSKMVCHSVEHAHQLYPVRSPHLSDKHF